MAHLKNPVRPRAGANSRAVAFCFVKKVETPLPDTALTGEADGFVKLVGQRGGVIGMPELERCKIARRIARATIPIGF